MSENALIAALLYDIADLITLKDEPFRARAYAKAARTIEEIHEALPMEHLTELPNVGDSIATIIREIHATGRSRLRDQLKEEFPPQIFSLMDVPGLGAKKAAQLYRTLHIGSVDELEEACLDGSLSSVKGFGPKTAARLLQGIETWRKREDGITLWAALALSERIRALVRDVPGVAAAEMVGALRRNIERSGSLEFLVATPAAEAVLTALTRLPQVASVVERSADRLVVHTARRHVVTFDTVAPEQFGARCIERTGAAAFVAALGPLEGATEEEAFARRGLPWIPPELRETAADVTAPPPSLVRLEDMRGDLHAHTIASDGGATLEQMAEAARALGYRYLAITEHSRSLPIANGLQIERLLEHGARIAELNRQWDDFRLLWGTECDILADGSMDYPDEILEKLDLVVGSIHSQFRMEPAAQTERILRAMRNPHVDVIGHPTGRLLSGRAGYELDWDRIIPVAVETGTALEINASPNRMDLRDEVAARLRAAGGKVAIDSDSHSTGELRYLALGVRIARRARLPAAQVINAGDM